MNDHQIEQEIQAKGLTAPRVKPEDITANIAHTEYVTHVTVKGQVLRWAILTTKNGFAVVGKPSVAVSSANDDEQIGRQVAYDNSRNELWPLMGYELRTKLAAQEKEAAYIAAAAEAENRIVRINQGDRSAAFTDDDLVYAAQSRCNCGAGLAYPKDSSPSGSWHCSDILTYRAATKDRADAKPHDLPFPFSIYSIKSENQPSAHGATTRPQPAHATATENS